MKKLIVSLVLVAIAGMMASCSSYTCPTYAKTAKKQPSTVSW